MDIKVGDRITYRYTDIDAINSTIIDGETSLEIHQEQIENGEKEILKIERPTGYEVVYEKKELLTEKEREFLKDIVKYYEVDRIYFDLDSREVGIYSKYNVCLVCCDFSEKLKFDNIKYSNNYTLSELGLEE